MTRPPTPREKGKSKTVNGKEYWWCVPRKCWARHHPRDCCAGNNNTDNSPPTNDSDNATQGGNNSSGTDGNSGGPVLRLSNALQSVVTDNG